ncbi:MAG: hypothetical protein GWN00_01740, partial [Aliifodinibius sp.]|nr:hypothetical protein [Fodinibius sp.]NIY23580.1 hypothetical protein [Fodinibius sp.]
EAAIDTLKQGNVKNVICTAVKNAAKKSKQLADSASNK